MFKRVVDVVELLVAMAAGVTIVLLFAATPTAAEETAADLVAGEQIYQANCSGCHGAGGEGGVGPSLVSGLTRFDTSADMVSFVSSGVPGRMPGFETRLTPDEIAVVAEYVWANSGRQCCDH